MEFIIINATEKKPVMTSIILDEKEAEVQKVEIENFFNYKITFEKIKDLK